MPGFFNKEKDSDEKRRLKEIEEQLTMKEDEIRSYKKRAQGAEEELATLRLKNEELYDKYARLSDRCRELEKQVENLAKHKDEPIIIEEEKPAEKPADKPAEKPREAEAAPAEVMAKLDKIIELAGDNAYKDDLIKKMHAEMLNLQGDVIAKATKPYLNAVIRVYTHLSDSFNSLSRTAVDEGGKPSEAARHIEAAMLMVQDVLEDEFDIVPFGPHAGDTFEPRLHYAVQTMPTSDPEVAGTISSCRQRGFRNIQDNRIVKQAVVIAYRLENKTK